jgi:6-phosphogluconolactonase (cycloisomerase 2 family)
VDPSGKFAYVANDGGNVSAYMINATTGALTEVLPRAAAGTNPRSITVDSSGRFAYVANFGGNVSTYTISAITGALTPIAGAPFAAGTGSFSVTTTGTIQ